MGNSFLEIRQELFHLLALHVGCAADRTAAADDRKAVLPGKLDDLLLLDVNQGPDDGGFAVIGKH